MGKRKGSAIAVGPGRGPVVRDGDLEAKVEGLMLRMARVDNWFRSPLFECRRCGRLYEVMSEMDVPKKGGYFDVHMRMCRVRKLKDDPRLMWWLDQCIGCRAARKGPVNG